MRGAAHVVAGAVAGAALATFLVVASRPIEAQSAGALGAGVAGPVDEQIRWTSVKGIAHGVTVPVFVAVPVPAGVEVRVGLLVADGGTVLVIVGMLVGVRVGVALGGTVVAVGGLLEAPVSRILATSRIQDHAPRDGSAEVEAVTSASACVGQWGPGARSTWSIACSSRDRSSTRWRKIRTGWAVRGRATSRAHSRSSWSRGR